MSAWKANNWDLWTVSAFGLVVVVGSMGFVAKQFWNHREFMVGKLLRLHCLVSGGWRIVETNLVNQNI
jgi:hypothetical protein